MLICVHFRSTMNVTRKRQFGLAFGVVNNVLEASRKQQRLRDSEDEEFMVMVAQFMGM